MGVTLKMNRDAKVALQVIYTQFRERGGQWPTFAYFERWLNRFRRQDAVQVLSRIPDEFLKPLTFSRWPTGSWIKASPHCRRGGTVPGK